MTTLEDRQERVATVNKSTCQETEDKMNKEYHELQFSKKDVHDYQILKTYCQKDTIQKSLLEQCTDCHDYDQGLKVQL